ncbi:hypothetical protein GCM10027407_04310 [Acetobacter peroxydans]
MNFQTGSDSAIARRNRPNVNVHFAELQDLKQAIRFRPNSVERRMLVMPAVRKAVHRHVRPT